MDYKEYGSEATKSVSVGTDNLNADVASDDKLQTLSNLGIESQMFNGFNVVSGEFVSGSANAIFSMPEKDTSMARINIGGGYQLEYPYKHLTVSPPELSATTTDDISIYKTSSQYNEKVAIKLGISESSFFESISNKSDLFFNVESIVKSSSYFSIYNSEYYVCDVSRTLTNTLTDSLSDHFKNCLKDIDRSLENGGEGGADQGFVNFFDTFGTHYLSRAKYGGRIVISSSIDQSYYDRSDSVEFKDQLKDSLSEIVANESVDFSLGFSGHSINEDYRKNVSFAGAAMGGELIVFSQSKPTSIVGWKNSLYTKPTLLVECLDVAVDNNTNFESIIKLIQLWVGEQYGVESEKTQSIMNRFESELEGYILDRSSSAENSVIVPPLPVSLNAQVGMESVSGFVLASNFPQSDSDQTQLQINYGPPGSASQKMYTQVNNFYESDNEYYVKYISTSMPCSKGSAVTISSDLGSENGAVANFFPLDEPSGISYFSEPVVLYDSNSGGGIVTENWIEILPKLRLSPGFLVVELSWTDDAMSTYGTAELLDEKGSTFFATSIEHVRAEIDLSVFKEKASYSIDASGSSMLVPINSGMSEYSLRFVPGRDDFMFPFRSGEIPLRISTTAPEIKVTHIPVNELNVGEYQFLGEGQLNSWQLASESGVLVILNSAQGVGVQGNVSVSMYQSGETESSATAIAGASSQYSGAVKVPQSTLTVPVPKGATYKIITSSETGSMSDIKACWVALSRI